MGILDHWEQWTQCTTTECRSNIINAVFRSDDPVAANWINSIEQPEEVSSKLKNYGPNILDVSSWYAQVNDNGLKETLSHLIGGPHLYAQGNVRPRRASPREPPKGPEASLILLPLVPNSPLRKVQPHTRPVYWAGRCTELPT